MKKLLLAATRRNFEGLLPFFQSENCWHKVNIKIFFRVLLYLLKCGLRSDINYIYVIIKN